MGAPQELNSGSLVRDRLNKVKRQSQPASQPASQPPPPVGGVARKFDGGDRRLGRALPEGKLAQDQTRSRTCVTKDPLCRGRQPLCFPCFPCEDFQVVCRKKKCVGLPTVSQLGIKRAGTLL